MKAQAEFWEKEIEADPEWFEAYHHAYLLYEGTAQGEKADAILERALSHPKFPEFAKNVKSLGKHFQVPPSDFYAARGSRRLRAGRMEQALADYGKAIENISQRLAAAARAPALPEAVRLAGYHFSRAALEAGHGSLESALRDLERTDAAIAGLKEKDRRLFSDGYQPLAAQEIRALGLAKHKRCVEARAESGNLFRTVLTDAGLRGYHFGPRTPLSYRAR